MHGNAKQPHVNLRSGHSPPHNRLDEPIIDLTQLVYCAQLQSKTKPRQIGNVYIHIIDALKIQIHLKEQERIFKRDDFQIPKIRVQLIGIWAHNQTTLHEKRQEAS